VITIPDLTTSLLDLLAEIAGEDIQLIIGGGFGIYLKTEFVKQLEARTLLDQWPEPRSTADIDLFLRPELLIKSEQLKPLADALRKLMYEPVPGAENYQFKKPGPDGGEAGSVKIDILTGPQYSFNGTRVKIDARRARPSPSVGIHAHPVDEAPTLEEGLLDITLNGKLSTGEPSEAPIFLPHPFTFLMMKLFAFKDRLDDENKDFGRYHALDLYTILATITEAEWEEARELRDQYAGEPYVKEACGLVSTLFVSFEQMGMIRLRESPYYREDLQLNDFMSTLGELFPSNA
jgi:hypothetical protein